MTECSSNEEAGVPFSRTVAEHAVLMLREARSHLGRLEASERIARVGRAFGDLTDDTEIKADIVLGDLLVARLAAYEGIGRVTCEGRGQTIVGDGPLHAFIDPLDGSLNYRRRGFTAGLPYTACVTVTDRRLSTFDDVIAAAVIDLRNGDLWHVWKENSFYRSHANLAPTSTEKETALDLGSQIVIGEMYYPENRQRLIRAFAGQEGWLRNPGSAAYEMALVASGTAVAFICDSQKQHELGAGYALVKGAGGVAVDFDGNDLGPRVYDFKTQTPVVLAANRAIADQIVHLLNL